LFHEHDKKDAEENKAEECKESKDTKSTSSNKEIGEDEEILEAWYEEKVREALMNKDNTTDKGDLSPGTSSDARMELTKKLSITIPVKPKERDDDDEVTKRANTIHQRKAELRNSWC
jgi:hypothetical protein